MGGHCFNITGDDMPWGLELGEGLAVFFRYLSTYVSLSFFPLFSRSAVSHRPPPSIFAAATAVSGKRVAFSFKSG